LAAMVDRTWRVPWLWGRCKLIRSRRGPVHRSRERASQSSTTRTCYWPTGFRQQKVANATGHEQWPRRTGARSCARPLSGMKRFGPSPVTTSSGTRTDRFGTAYVRARPGERRVRCRDESLARRRTLRDPRHAVEHEGIQILRPWQEGRDARQGGEVAASSAPTKVLVSTGIRPVAPHRSATAARTSLVTRSACATSPPSEWPMTIGPPQCAGCLGGVRTCADADPPHLRNGRGRRMTAKGRAATDIPTGEERQQPSNTQPPANSPCRQSTGGAGWGRDVDRIEVQGAECA